MKTIRVSQPSMRQCLNRRVNHQLSQELKLEALPKLDYPPPPPLKQNVRKGFMRWLLPEGYPHSVHGNYFSFTAWTSLQGISSSILGVLSTQAMLGTLMQISNSDSVGFLGSGAAAATINWILKDGLGQAGGILLVSLLGSRLDSHARFLRFHSSVLFLLAALLEFMIPCIVHAGSSNGSGLFLLLASSGNVLKNVSWMLGSATRAHFMKQLAHQDNIGDLTGKAASQMTLASLIGTGIGLMALKWDLWLPGFWTLNAAFTLLAAYKSCKWAVSKRLNPARLHSIIETFKLSVNKFENPNHFARYIWTPEIVASRENFVSFGPKCSRYFIINASLEVLESKTALEWIVPMDKLEETKFCVARFQDKLYIWTLDSASSRDELTALITATLHHANLFQINPKQFIEAMQSQGWETESFHSVEFKKNQLTLLLNNNNDNNNKNSKDKDL